MKKRILPILLACTLLLLTACRNGAEQTNTGNRGSADHCSGNTVICTIFVNNPQNHWDFSRAEDASRRKQICTYLGIACDYLQEQAEKYHRSLHFTYDFTADDDLSDTYTTDLSYETEDWDMSLWKYIDAGIPADELLKKYKAENILFLTCMNTDETNTAISSTRNWYADMPYPYEFISLYFVDSGEINAPAIYAHEILHCFGAPDLYAPDDEYGIGSSFVSWIGENFPNDIMYTCSDLKTGEYAYDQITNEISDVTAYYIGWTDRCRAAEQAGLKQSQYQ